jgi:hypothetical protein
MQRRILDALDANPVPARRLSRQAHSIFNAYFRQQLAGLVRRGLARHTADGFSRP